MLPLDNCLILTGRLLEVATLRYTPAGIPAVNFSVAHVSQQLEAGVLRKVECEMQVLALGSSAQLLSGVQLGAMLKLTGFLAAKSLKSRTPVLHVNEIEFLEGIQNGI